MKQVDMSRDGSIHGQNMMADFGGFKLHCYGHTDGHTDGQTLL